MAKSKKSEADPNDYILVTEKNRKSAITLGRILYVCEVTGIHKKKLNVISNFDVRPRLRKGWNTYGSNKFFCQEDESHNDWRDNFKSVIDMEIKAKRLYINTKNRLKKYDKAKVR